MKLDISNEVSLENGKANPFGWSVKEIHYQGKYIGMIYCGHPQDFEPGFSFEMVDEGKNDEGKNVTRLIIYKEQG